MKHKGALSEYSQERTEELLSVYNAYISRCHYIRMDEVCNTIVNTPCSRFWVSDKRASVVVSSILRDESVLLQMWPLRREMYQEIYRRVLSLKSEYPHLSIAKLCSIVVSQPAPKFYLSSGTANVIICKARKHRSSQRLKSLLKNQ